MIDLTRVFLFLSVVPLFTIAFAARSRFGNWRHPASFLSALWVCACAPAIVANLAPISVLSLAVTWAMIGAFVAGAFAVPRMIGGIDSTSDPREWTFDSARLHWFVSVLGVAGVSSVIFYIWTAAADLASLGTLVGWVDIAVKYSVARYNGEETEALFVRLLIGLNYAGAILAGVLFAQRDRRRRNRFVFLPVLSCCLITLVTTAKTPLLLGILCMVSGNFAARGNGPRTTLAAPGRSRLRALGAIILVAAVSIVSLGLRYGGAAGADFALIVERSAGYLIGPVYAFSAWVSTGGLTVSDPGLGKYSIAGIFELLGVATREPGLYAYIVINEASADSNVFSAFRGLIQDLLLPGALAFMFLLGVVTESLARMRGNAWAFVVSVSLLSAIYLFLGWSPIISIFNYNDVHFAMFVVSLVLFGCVTVNPTRSRAA